MVEQQTHDKTNGFFTRAAHPMFPLRYVCNIMSRPGRVARLLLGAEASVRIASAAMVVVDQRDGFEVALSPCESATASPTASPRLSPGG